MTGALWRRAAGSYPAGMGTCSGTKTIGQISALGAALVLIVASSCSGPDFGQRFAGLETGATRADVEEALGASDETEQLEIPEGPYWGPSEGLSSVLPPGTPLEQWRYRRGDDDYYVWFASTEGEARGEWRLAGKANYPVGAVFEAR